MSLIIDSKKIKFATEGSPFNRSCPSCLVDWQSQDKVIKLTCGHLYCDRTGCLEDITRLANSKCALCRAPIQIDQNKRQNTFNKLVHAGMHVLNPNSIAPPELSAANIEDAIQYTRLYGTDEQKATIDRHEAIMAEKERQEEISKRILLVVAPILCIGLAGLTYYFLQK